MSQYAGIYYKNNYLEKVIVRVDFVSPIASIEAELPQKVSQAILTNFPISEPREVIAQELKIAPNQDISAQRKSVTEWHFHGKDRDKTLVIVPTSIFVVHNRYQTYEKVRNEFLDILKVFYDFYTEAQPSRLGLRYVNSIRFSEGNPFDWNSYIAPQLLALLEFPTDKRCLSRLFHTIELALDECNLRYQFGLHNPDFPARIRQRVFVLDFDAYRQGAIDHAEMPNSLDAYHHRIQELFEMSITPELRRIMNE